jgi:PadR family transcriptional regulator AphA
MSLEYAILGFLNYQPFTGYDLKKVFDQSVRHFWSADQSQIYRTLAQLTEKGWTEVEIIEQIDRPDRKVYHITSQGREELKRWLAGPIPLQEPRNAALIQVFFAGQMTDAEILSKFEEAANQFRQVLKRYEVVPNKLDEITQDIGSPRETYFWMLTLELGIKTMRANLEWAENVIRVIQNKELPDR